MIASCDNWDTNETSTASTWGNTADTRDYCNSSDKCEPPRTEEDLDPPDDLR